MIENIEVLQDLCKKVGVEYSTTIWSVEQFIDFSRRCYEQGREDAFLEIAYSDDVIKEQFEKLAYEKGIADERERIIAELEELRDRFDKNDFAIRGILEKAIEIVRGDVKNERNE